MIDCTFPKKLNINKSTYFFNCKYRGYVLPGEDSVSIVGWRMR